MIEVTDTIVLKSISLEDVQVIFTTIDNEREHLRKWLPFVDTTLQKSDTFAFVQKVIEEDMVEYTILYNGEFVGLIGFSQMDTINKKAEIGYWLSQKAEGKGIITMSIKKLIEHAFDELGLNKLAIKAAIDNQKSRKIPEKLGFQLEGIERAGELLCESVFTDLAVYGLLKNEYKP